MAETLGAKPKAPKKKADKPADDNVVQLDNTPPEERLAATLLNGIAELRAVDEKIEQAASRVKNLRADRKAITGKLGAAGIPAAIIKEGMEKAAQARSDQSAYEATRAFVFKTMGLASADWAASLEGLPSAAAEEIDWEARGYVAGVMANDRHPPSECPPDRQQAWFKGYDKVMEARALKMAPKPQVEPGAVDLAEPPLILNETNFASDTSLEDASLATLNDDQRDNVASHERVIVRFGDKERVMKEPGYLDDGTDAAGVSEITDVPTGSA